MPANIPNLGAVHAVGAQFNHGPNVFTAAQKHFAVKSRSQLTQHNQAVQQRDASRNQAAQSAQRVVQTGRTNFARNVQQTQRAAQQAARAHAQGVSSGRVAPHPTAPPRTFAMGPTPQQRQTNQTQAAQTRAVRSQVNFAHGQAIQEGNKRAKQSNTTPSPSAPSTLASSSPAPSFSNSPTVHTATPAARPIAPTTFSHQFPGASPNTPESPGYLTQDPSAIARHIRNLGGQFSNE